MTTALVLTQVLNGLQLGILLFLLAAGLTLAMGMAPRGAALPGFAPPAPDRRQRSRPEFPNCKPTSCYCF